MYSFAKVTNECVKVTQYRSWVNICHSIHVTSPPRTKLPFRPIVHFVLDLIRPVLHSDRSLKTLNFCHRAQAIRADAMHAKRRAATSVMQGRTEALHRIHEDREKQFQRFSALETCNCAQTCFGYAKPAAFRMPKERRCFNSTWDSCVCVNVVRWKKCTERHWLSNVIANRSWRGSLGSPRQGDDCSRSGLGLKRGYHWRPRWRRAQMG